MGNEIILIITIYYSYIHILLHLIKRVSIKILKYVLQNIILLYSYMSIYFPNILLSVSSSSVDADDVKFNEQCIWAEMPLCVDK